MRPTCIFPAKSALCPKPETIYPMPLVKHLNTLDFIALGLAGGALILEFSGWTLLGMAMAVLALVTGAISLKRGHGPKIQQIYPLPSLENTSDHCALYDHDYVVFDIESTGILPHKDELLRIGAKKISGGQILHGTDFDRRAEGELAAAVQDFHAFANNGIYVGHNAAFKLAFVKFHEKRIGVAFDRTVLDLVLLSSLLFGPDAPHDTDSICARLGIDTAAAGRKLALAKARRSSVIFETMLPYLHAKGFETLEELQDACKEQAVLLNAR